VQIDSANKAIGIVGSLYRTISDHYQLDLPDIFQRLRLRGGETCTRPPFTSAFLQEQLLAEGCFDRINPEARRLLYLIIETGLRPSEACNLTQSTIILDHSIPHVLIRPEGRELKSKSAMRDIPLVGVALKAMIAQPRGFPRYRDNSDALSAVLNKALLQRGFRATGTRQSLYSIRHSFSDRLRNAGAPDSAVRYLMGHASAGPRYGDGLSLENKRAWLALISLQPPSRV